jgi:hypothetical protein
MGPLRPLPDPFDVGNVCSGAMHSPAATAAAERIALTMGEHCAEIDAYLGLLGYAPADHIGQFGYRGGRIFFAPTVAHYLLSPEAAIRRKARLQPALTAVDRRKVADEYGPMGSVVAAYDHLTDVLILPYSRSVPDKLRSVLHELGHAMTWPHLRGREDRYAHVMKQLPVRIRKHLACGYAPDLATRIHETFAEAYAMLVCERLDELGPIASELIDILQSVSEDPNSPSDPCWQLDLKAGISASMAPDEALSQNGPMYDTDDLLQVRSTSDARSAALKRAA